jgi:hypothetical protein
MNPLTDGDLQNPIYENLLERNHRRFTYGTEVFFHDEGLAFICVIMSDYPVSFVIYTWIYLVRVFDASIDFRARHYFHIVL